MQGEEKTKEEHMALWILRLTPKRMTGPRVRPGHDCAEQQPQMQSFMPALMVLSAPTGTWKLGAP